MVRADTSLRFLKGVGPKRALAFEQAGVFTVEDLLYVLPFRHEDRRSFSEVRRLRPGGPECTVDVHVATSRLIRTRRPGFTIFEAKVSDAGGSIRAVWYNQPYLERVLPPGRRAVLFGRPTLDRRGGSVVLENAEVETLDEGDAAGIHTGRIVPVYRKLAGLSSRRLRALLHRALDEVDPAGLADLVPTAALRRHDLSPRLAALRDAHFPSADADLADLADRRTVAQRTLAFEEIFLLQLALAVRRRGMMTEERLNTYDLSAPTRARLARLLPFRLTAAQQRVLGEIGSDLRSRRPMNRLLQGDVGSGKTIVAFLALMAAVENGYQGALMAPTEILADQHLRNLTGILERAGSRHRPVRITGSLRSSERRRILGAVASGEARLVVGTHAVFESGVTFARLALVVVDEQHRFGVLQRAALAAKGRRPDVLVMTATPIPRSLALTVYGDLDLSVLDELPPGRAPITTIVRREADRERVYAGLRRELAAGRQAYVVVPLVEETERSDLKAATAFARGLREGALRGLEVGLLHGRLKAEEKDAVMAGFVSGRVRALVATTVVEVGVDVANATVMIVEHAERFGLSQLHQLRGRVGRGSAKSYCVLMVGNEGAGKEAEGRLAILSESSDGFRIAERDLELRGPGAFFGTQQHGLSDLQFLAMVLRDPALLEAARDEARGMAARGNEAAALLAGLRPAWRRRLDLAGVG